MKVEILTDYSSKTGHTLKQGTIVRVSDETRKDLVVVTKEGYYWSIPKRLTKKALD